MLGRGDLRTPPVDLFRPCVLLADRVPERLGHVPDGGLRPVADHVRDLGRVPAAVLPVDVLDHLLPAVGVEVDVDIRLLGPGRGEEPLERQVVEDAVDRGDPERVADRRVRRGTPALAEDPVGVGEPDDVLHDQEVPREPLLRDDRQLTLQPFVRIRPLRGGAVAQRGTLQRQLPQPRHRRLPRRHVPQRQLGFGPAQIEGDLVRDRHRPPHRSGEPLEPGGHLGPRPQERHPGRRQPAVHRVQVPPGPDRGHRGGQLVLRRGGVVNVVGGNYRESAVRGQGGQRPVPGRVGRQVVVDQLDHHPVLAEQARQPVQLPPRGGRTVGVPTDLQGLPDQPLPAPGQDQPAVATPLGEILQVVDRAALLTTGQLRLGDRTGQPVIPLLPLRQHQQVTALGIGHTVLRAGQAEGELRPEHRGQLVRRGRLGEPGRAVEPVVIGQRQRVQPLPDRGLDQVLRLGGTVQEGEVRVHVQLGVGHRVLGPAGGQRHVRSAMLRPRRAVAAVGRHRAVAVTARPRAVRQLALQLRPLDRRIVVAHRTHLPSTTRLEHVFEVALI